MTDSSSKVTLLCTNFTCKLDGLETWQSSLMAHADNFQLSSEKMSSNYFLEVIENLNNPWEHFWRIIKQYLHCQFRISTNLKQIIYNFIVDIKKKSESINIFVGVAEYNRSLYCKEWIVIKVSKQTS